MILNRGNTRRHRIAAVGMYDGVHLGHRFLIDYMTLEGHARGLTPAAVTFSNHPLSVVRPDDTPPQLMSAEEKMSRLEQAGADDVIVLNFTEKMRRMSARQFLTMLHKRWAIDALVVGFNNRFGRDRIDGFEQYQAIGREIGIEVIESPEYQGTGAPVSSSIIRAHLENGAIKEANTALGRYYELTGLVVPGKRIGRTLGFPTANIEPELEGQCVPGCGVYAVLATTPDGVRRAAILNIGHRPTVEDDPEQAPISIEAHILDYGGYLYGERLKVEFVERLRDEKRFASADKLRKALASDSKRAKALLTPLLGNNG